MFASSTATFTVTSLSACGSSEILQLLERAFLESKCTACERVRRFSRLRRFGTVKKRSQHVRLPAILAGSERTPTGTGERRIYANDSECQCMLLHFTTHLLSAGRFSRTSASFYLPSDDLNFTDLWEPKSDCRKPPKVYADWLRRRICII